MPWALEGEALPRAGAPAPKKRRCYAEGVRWVATAGVAIALAGCSFSTDGIGTLGAGDPAVAKHDVIILVDAAPADGADGPASERGATVDGAGDAAPDLPMIVDGTAHDTMVDSGKLGLGELCASSGSCASGHCERRAGKVYYICCAVDCHPRQWDEGCRSGGIGCAN